MNQSGFATGAGNPPAGLAHAALSIAVTNGVILACDAGAARLLGGQSEAIVGQSWSALFDCEDGSHGVLAQAILAAVRTSLPPFLLHGADGIDRIIDGLLLPQHTDNGTVLQLYLWQLWDEADLPFSDSLTPSDTLAVMGVDQLHYSDSWDAAHTARLMQELRASLLDIVRPADSVGQPHGAAVIILLHNVDTEGARDICRALLSHLHSLHTPAGGPLAAARICVGLGRRSARGSALAALAAANNALLQAQSGGAREHIHAARAEDGMLLAGRVLNAAGIFGGRAVAAPEVTTKKARGHPKPLPEAAVPAVAPIEKNIDGYVVDNMEGAVDQAIFMAQLDIPVAIIGPAGTGKMYVARIIHDESGAAPDMLVPIDCREFRGRSGANTRIARELAQGEGKTLVFKSPQLLHAESQAKLARQLTTRTRADVTPPQYLPKMKVIALFPEPLELLVKRGELTEALASAFAAYPIHVPPIRDRQQAVLRWAHKILGQEGVSRDRDMKGFTPDAEQAMLLYDWPGNISEMRQCIFAALEKTDRDWLTPVDLGLFKGINPEGTPVLPQSRAFLTPMDQDEGADEPYEATTLESLDVALGEAVHNMLELELVKPLGTWAEDDLVLAALDRYRKDVPRTAEFLHTKARNINRWIPRIEAREEERGASALWQKPRRLLREWVRESGQLGESPLLLIEARLLAHVDSQARELSVANRARIMGVSTPTYLKRLRETL